MRNALWERLHLRLVSARALPVQLARTRTSLGLLFARCACRESLQVRRVQRVSARAFLVQLVRIRMSLGHLFADYVHRVRFQIRQV